MPGDQVQADRDAIRQAAREAGLTGEAISLNLLRILKVIEESSPVFNSHAGDAFRLAIDDELGTPLKKLLSVLNELADQLDDVPGIYQAGDVAAAAEIERVAHTYLPVASPIADALTGK
jgi:hypothetical protein